jgi:hypothetical protein
MEMIFKELYLFSPTEKRARRITFEKGINVVTSNKADGTKRGKSVIMRSLFHALGAEAFFDSFFEADNKVFILHFEVDTKGYYIYRAADLFKVFDENTKLLFTATRARELSCKLSRITGFHVELPSRGDGRLEITPPVYNYLPFFLDQDGYNGSKFDSFKNLGQYANFKENVLFCHFGVYTKEYFDLEREREKLETEEGQWENRIAVLGEIAKDLHKKLEGRGYSKDLTALKRDVEQYQRQYSKAVHSLNASRQHLIGLRNELCDFKNTIEGIEAFERKNETAIKRLHNHECPECGSFLEMPVSLQSRRYNLAEDIIGVKTDIQKSMIDLEEKIAKEEIHYKELLDVLHQYEQSMKIRSTEMNDVLRFKGLCEVREDVAEEIRCVQEELERISKELCSLLKKIKEYNKRKEQVTKRYYELLLQARNRFGLNEIKPDQFKKLSKYFTAGGSNGCIATIVWHFAIIKLRNEFNPEAIQFPVVFDSPNNVETDDVKTEALIQYLLENSDVSSQFIISGIGFDTEEFKAKTDKPMKIIKLDNKQYNLLQEADYQDHLGLLETFCNAGLLSPREQDEDS